VDLVLHASYDRIFRTPSFENILLSNSSTVEVLNPDVLRLPVQPSHGDYYEAGLTQGFFGQFRLDADIFRRVARNYADDDQFLNTGVSFPIAFDKAIIDGAEGKLEIPHWRNLSGFLSYSYTVGDFFPVTGGLFLGVDATNATTQLTGHFPDSPDQRNTLRTRFRYQVRPPPYHATPGRRTKSEQSPERSLFRQRDCAVTQRCASRRILMVLQRICSVFLNAENRTLFEF
jgi:hypothetical protein